MLKKNFFLLHSYSPRVQREKNRMIDVASNIPSQGLAQRETTVLHIQILNIHDHLWSRLYYLQMRKDKAQKVMCFTQVLRASESQRLIQLPASFLSTAQASLSSGELNLLAPKFPGL